MLVISALLLSSVLPSVLYHALAPASASWRTLHSLLLVGAVHVSEKLPHGPHLRAV